MPTKDLSEYTDDELRAYAKAKDYTDEELLAIANQGSGNRGLKAMGKHALNELSLGYYPELEAGARSILTPKKDRKSFEQLRNQAIRDLKQSEKDYPEATTAGKGIGIGASFFLPVGAPAKGIGLLARMGKAAKAGALFGVLRNPNTEEGKTGLNIPERLINAAVSAPLAASFPAGMAGLRKTAGMTGKGIQKGFTFMASNISGIPDKLIENQIKRGKEIPGLVDKAGGVDLYLDEIRQGAMNAIQSKKRELGERIGKSIEESDPSKFYSLQPVLSYLKTQLAKLDPIKEKEAITGVKGLIQKVEEGVFPSIVKSANPKLSDAQIQTLTGKLSKTVKPGETNLKYVNFTKEDLQNLAQSSYMKDGQIFQNAPQTANISKGAARITRNILNQASPEVSEANTGLSYLHLLDKRIPKNLIKEGGPGGALLSAGSGVNTRNQRWLERVGKKTGYPFLQKAKDAATYGMFSPEKMKDALLPIDPTGRSLTRLALASSLPVIGGLFGGGEGAMSGAGVATMLASPLSVKAAIGAGRIPRQIVHWITGKTDKLTSGDYSKIQGALSSLLTQSEGANVMKEIPSLGADTDLLGAMKRKKDKKSK